MRLKFRIARTFHMYMMLGSTIITEDRSSLEIWRRHIRCSSVV